MIHRSKPYWQTSDWQYALKNMIRSLDELLVAVNLSSEQLNISEEAAKQFSLKTPRSYVANIEKGNPKDPLLLQVLPDMAETIEHASFVADPLEEAHFNKAPGLIHKYHGRVLLITNPSCAIHCRYCFRRHFDYSSNTPGSKGWQPALNYIASDSSIYEVILSGGDPLSSTDNHLSQVLHAIAGIAHVKSVRLHTRLPTVIPQRITENLLEALTSTRLKAVMVLHINHANELGHEQLQAIRHLKQWGIRILNQSVLLKGVNDSVDSLNQLMRSLFENDIEAYYLHQLDRVAGASHFALNNTQALNLYRQLQAQLPGFMLPKLVRELPHKKNKTLMTENTL